MFFTILISVQLIVFTMMFVIERCFPRHKRAPQKGFSKVWCVVLIFAAIWAKIVFFVWVNTEAIGPQLSNHPVIEGGLFYGVYSFVNYWVHRLKHRWYPAWRYLHYMHHAPSHMDSRIAFYRHPIEMVVNSVILLILGKVILNVSPEAVAVALVIEGSLETFHHSNIKLPSWMWPIGYIIQLPEQHLLHHQQGVHKYNYSPLTLWDTLFGTVAFTQDNDFLLGFKDSGRAWLYFIFKK